MVRAADSKQKTSASFCSSERREAHSESELTREASRTALESSSLRHKYLKKAPERQPPENRMCASVEPDARRSCAIPRRESCQQKRGNRRARQAALILSRARAEDTDQMLSFGAAPEAHDAVSCPRRAQCPQSTVAIVEEVEQEQVREMTAPLGAFLRLLKTTWASEIPARSLK